MKKLLLFVCLAVGSLFAQNGGNGNPCYAPNTPIYAVNGTTTAATTAQIVAAVGYSRIYICSVNETSLSAVASSTFALVYGTGSNCITGTTTIAGPTSIATANVTNSYGPSGITPAGQALCYTTVGAAATNNYSITYAQQ